MKKPKPKSYRYIYGPVSSWRLGRSLGIDLLSGKKVCNLNCIYCQLGRTFKYTTERKIYVPTGKILKELADFPKIGIDYITFSGMGEPTLAKNLGSAIRAVKRIRKEPIAVLTNSLLMHNPGVRKELALADFVIAKLDSFCETSFKLINRPAAGIKFSDIYNGLRAFRKEYRKRFAIQVMFVEKNMNDAARIASLSKRLHPDEIELNTPLRPCSMKCLSKGQMSKIKRHFKALKTISVYEVERKKAVPISRRDVVKRRGRP